MKKNRLEIDSLTVETFVTETTDAGQGTVHGHAVRTDACSVPAAPCTADCSAGGEQTCTRLRSDYATCVVDCECTNRYEKCLPGM